MGHPIDHTAAVEAAVRAPSLHNSQPWRFRVHDGTVEVRLDPARRLPTTDPDGWAGRLAIGAAVLNLRLAMAVQHRQPLVRLLPGGDRRDPDLLAEITAGPDRPPTPTQRRLYQAIARRHSNRQPFWPDPVPAQARSRLVAAAREEGAWLVLLIGPAPVAAVAEVARAADQVLMRDPAYRAELAAWTRDRPAPDGVPAGAGGPCPQPYDLFPTRPFADQPRLPGHDFEPQPLVAILGTAGDTPGDQLVAGQALQRVLLTATGDDLAVSLLSQPIEVPSAREQLRTALGQHGPPQMVLRVGYGVPGVPTPRRPLAEVVDNHDGAGS
jgi:hypothetical protein